jgi:hypothetical protein
VTGKTGWDSTWLWLSLRSAISAASRRRPSGSGELLGRSERRVLSAVSRRPRRWDQNLEPSRRRSDVIGSPGWARTSDFSDKQSRVGDEPALPFSGACSLAVRFALLTCAEVRGLKRTHVSLAAPNRARGRGRSAQISAGDQAATPSRLRARRNPVSRNAVRSPPRGGRVAPHRGAKSGTVMVTRA